MAEEALKNIALLIDADNASAAGIDPVLTVLAELGQVNVRRAYGNWQKQALSKWDKITHRFGLQPVQQFDLTKGKNATDMAMTIDAIDLLYGGKVDGFGSAKAPEAFKTACTRFIDVDQLIRTQAQDEAPKVSDNSPIDPELIELLGAAWKAAS